MKVTVLYGPHFKANVNRCYDYLVKRYQEELNKPNKKEA